MEETITLNNLSEQNVTTLNEAQVFPLLKQIYELKSDNERAGHLKILSNKFQFRYILAKKKLLKQELEMSGYVFPSTELFNGTNMVVGIRKAK